MLNLSSVLLSSVLFLRVSLRKDYMLNDFIHLVFLFYSFPPTVGYFLRMMSFLYRLFEYFEKGLILPVVKCAFVPCKGLLTKLFIVHYWNTFYFFLFHVLCMLHQAFDLSLLFLGQFIQIVFLIFQLIQFLNRRDRLIP